ncbi:MAG: hypothetical protein AAB036_05865 [Elusimicrobiota bacterium]
MDNYGWAMPVAASSFAKSIDLGIWIIHAAMLAIFVLWGIFFVYLLVKYRARPGVLAQREEAHSRSSELTSLIPDLAVVAFEIGLIVFYALPVWSKVKMSVPDVANPLQLEIVAEQFGWSVHYPGPDGALGPRKAELVHFSNPIGLDHNDPASHDDVVMGNELRLPLGRTAVMKLYSKDVIHSLFIPEFRLKQDAVPGLEIPVWVEPTRLGKYEITCAQLCGFAHGLMRGDVFVQTQEDFDAWYQSRLATTPAPDKPTNPSEDF